MSAAAPARGLDCDILVELVTDFLDGALDPATQVLVEAHLLLCPGCWEFVEQVRTTAALLGDLGDDGAFRGGPLEPVVRDALLAAFRLGRSHAQG